MSTRVHSDSTLESELLLAGGIADRGLHANIEVDCKHGGVVVEYVVEK